MIKRCAIYIRVSTAMQRLEGWSLEAQRDGLAAYAASQGWKIVDVYADEGRSARKRLKNRKEIHRLLADVESGLIDVILFKELDRWFRNVSDFYKVQDVLDAHGVTWVSERQPTLRMDTKEGRMTVNVLLSVGQNEADSASERVRYTMKYLWSLRRWPCGPQNLPYGYTLDEDHHVIIDRDKEPYVRDLLDAFFRTSSIHAAIDYTNAAHGGGMSYPSASHWFKNALLYGEYKGVPGFVEEPYMTREEFERMRALVIKNVRRLPSATYIFPGLVFCSRCGSPMCGCRSASANGRLYDYYRCSRQAAYHTCGNRLRAAEKKIEAHLLAIIRPALDEKIVEIKAIEEARKKTRRPGNRAQIEKKLDKLEDLYINSDHMTKAKYEEKRAAIMAQLVEEDTGSDMRRIEQLEAVRAALEGPFEAAYMSMDNLEKRRFWRGIISRIEADDGHVTAVDFIE